MVMVFSTFLPCFLSCQKLRRRLEFLLVCKFDLCCNVKNSAPTTSHLNVVVQSPSLHWRRLKWLVNSPRVSFSGDSPLDNSSHFLSLLSNARSLWTAFLNPIDLPLPLLLSFGQLFLVPPSTPNPSLLIPPTADTYLYASPHQR